MILPDFVLSRQSSGGASNVNRVNTSTAQVHTPIEHTAHVETPLLNAKSGIQMPRLDMSDLASLIKDKQKKEAFGQ